MKLLYVFKESAPISIELAWRISLSSARRLLADQTVSLLLRQRRQSTWQAGHEMNPPAGSAMSGDYLGGRAARRFAGTPLRCLVTGFLVSAASNNCRNPCANSSRAFPKAPSCPTRTIATDRCRSNDGGRNTFTGSIE
jgi:hypothetical protein